MHFAAFDDSGASIRDAAFASTEDISDIIAVQRDYLAVIGSSVSVIDAGTLNIKRTLPTPFTSGNSVLATDGSTALLANDGGSARLLDADGDAIAPDLAFASGATGPIGVAAAHDVYLVVWVEKGRLMRSAIRNDGRTMSAAATLITIDSDRFAIGRRSIASDGENFLVSWRSGTAVHAMLVSRDGAVLREPATIGFWEYTDAPQVAWNGRQFVVAIETRDLEGAADIIAVRVNAQGEPAGEPQSVADGPQLQYRPDVATTTRSVLAVWGEFANCYEAGFGGIMARTIEPLGAIVNASRGVGVREAPAAADAGDITLVTWVERGALRHLRAALLPSQTQIEIPATSYAQETPAAGTNGDSFLVVWPELQSDCTTSLSAAIVDREGHVASVRTLANDAHPKTRPAIAWNGSEYVVVWERAVEAQLVALRIAADGTPIDSLPIALTASYPNPPYYTHHTGFPAIVWTGSEYLASWTYSRTSYIPFYPDPPPILEVRVRRFSRDVAPIDVESVIATPAYGSTLGWNGSEGLAVWQGSGSGIHASRIDADGRASAPNFLGPNPTWTPSSLSIAWTGHDWVATAGPRLMRIGANGSLQSFTDLGTTVSASAVTPTILAYDRSENAAAQIYTRRVSQPRRRAVW
jgi:hypothetical protein